MHTTLPAIATTFHTLLRTIPMEELCSPREGVAVPYHIIPQEVRARRRTKKCIMAGEVFRSTREGLTL